MRVFISMDMEGVAGVVHGEETMHNGKDFDRFRRLMTAEANAAALGAFDAGAELVVINDSHAGMRNVMIEELDPRVELISGSPKKWGMMQGVDEGFDACAFVGYHSRARTPGVLNHTYSGTVAEYRVNGIPMGEVGMNACLAGHYSVPLVLVAGDDCVTAEAEDLVEGVHTVVVKHHVGRQAARSYHPKRACRLLREGMQAALQKELPAPFRVGKPVTITLSFANTKLADASLLLPGAELVDPVTVSYQAPDYAVALQAARALIHLAG